MTLPNNDPLRLLNDDDPDPVEVVRRDGSSPFVLTAEHAGRQIPSGLGSLGLPPEQLNRHIAWDIGIAGVTRRLSDTLDAAAVLQRYSRLVVDCNRWPSSTEFVTSFSEDTEIPGNLDLDDKEIAARAREIFYPYHDTVSEILDARAKSGIKTVIVTMHSCTPVYLGVSRPWHVGVLYDKDPRFGRVLLELLSNDDRLCVGDNQPYTLSGSRDYAVPVHGERRGLLHVEFEIRQDLIESQAGQTEWACRIADVLREGLGRLRETGDI